MSCPCSYWLSSCKNTEEMQGTMLHYLHIRTIHQSNMAAPGRGVMTPEAAYFWIWASERPGFRHQLCQLPTVWIHFSESVFLLGLHETIFVYSLTHGKLSINGRSNKIIMIFAFHSLPLSRSSKFIQKTNYSTSPPECPSGPQNLTG